MLNADAVAEIAARGNNTLELFAVASEIAVRDHPQDFGECEDMATHERRLVELTLKRDEAFARIRKHALDDPLIEESGGDQARVSFRASGGAVPVFPLRDAPERLINWLARNS
jgi:hypothetical protein